MTETDLQIAEKCKLKIIELLDYIEQNPTEYLNLTRGEIGKILYYFYASRVITERQDELMVKGSSLLTRILSIVASGEDKTLLNPTLSNGLAGLGLTIEILINEGFIEDELNEYLCNIDKYVFENAIARIQNGNVDYLHGGGGSFHYLYYRIEKNTEVKSYLETFVDTLENIAVVSRGGLYFPNIYMKDLSQESEVNLGLSHGMVSVLLILANLYEAGIRPEKCKALIEGGVNFILSFQNTERFKEGEFYNFPNSIILNQDKYSTDNLNGYRGGLRWCYGDMNIMHLLYKVAPILERPELRILADQIGESILPIRGIAETRCHGSLFCHGATGIAYYYKYLSRISGIEAYMEAYDYWLDKSFELFENEVQQSLFTEISGYFLEGFVGSSLVLMDAIEDQEPYWEKVWLLS
ncbi:MAG: lanthionine synthetase LanC family protein [Spirosomataceae bacterium]